MIRLLSIALISALTPLASSAAASGDRHHQTARDYYEAGFPRLIVLQTPREGVLQNRSPYRSSVRSYTNDRGGNPYNATSGLPYGASPGVANEMVVVRPNESVPYIAISPWEPITDRTIDELERNYPWLRRTESIRNDLVIARNRYLRERGYVGTVRGFRNESHHDADTAVDDRPVRIFVPGESKTDESVEPQLVIIESDQAEASRIAEDRLKPESVIRLSESSEE